MDGKIILSIIALLCATIVEMYALSLGIDGIMLAGYLGIIGAVVGIPAGIVVQKKKTGT